MQKNNPPFESFETIIEGGHLPHQSEHNHLLAGLQAIVSKSHTKFNQIAKQFCHVLSDSKQIYLHQQYLSENLEDIKFMVCKNNKAYSFKLAEFRGFVITGKAVSVYLRKKKFQDDQGEFEHREQFCNLVIQGMMRLHQDGKIILNKSQKQFTLSDILLEHDMPDAKTDQVLIANQVYSPFVPIQKTIVMFVPFKPLRPDSFDFIKSSIFHGYLQEAGLLSRIICKQNFYKNSILRGIYFIDEGQIEVSSGRIIARGWICFGKCKVSGVAWKFKPIPFVRFLSKNPSVWKQFLNDLQLNEELPFNIVHILGLNDDDDFTGSAEWKALGRKKFGGARLTKLPKLTQMQHKSFDEAKFQEIQRLRHYDEKLNDLFSIKEDLLARRLKGIVHGKFQPIIKNEELQKKMQQKKKILDRINSKRSYAISKKMTQPDLSTSQANQNVLVISVLKRLQSIADLQDSQHQPQLLQNSRHLYKGSTKRENVRISPAYLHERTKSLKKKNYRYLKS